MSNEVRKIYDLLVQLESDENNILDVATTAANLYNILSDYLMKYGLRNRDSRVVSVVMERDNSAYKQYMFETLFDAGVVGDVATVDFIASNFSNGIELTEEEQACLMQNCDAIVTNILCDRNIIDRHIKV